MVGLLVLLPMAVVLVMMPILRVLVLTSARASVSAPSTVFVAQAMVQVQEQVLEGLAPMLPLVLVQALVLLVLVQALVLLVLTGGGSGNRRGPMKPMMKSGMSTARRWLRWRRGKIASAVQILRTT